MILQYRTIQKQPAALIIPENSLSSAHENAWQF